MGLNILVQYQIEQILSRKWPVKSCHIFKQRCDRLTCRGCLIYQAIKASGRAEE